MNLYLIRGLPGSGKSTLASNLRHHLHALHYEADMYFGDNYDFDVSRLRAAHMWCQHMTKEALAGGHSAIVSNTFTTKKELKPYFEIAKEYGLTPCVIHCENQYGSIHGVPEETMKKMKARWCNDISSLFTE